MRSMYFVGLDLGQKQDPTALAVVEWAEYAGAWDAVTFEHRKETSLSLRHLERVPLGTPYPEVVYRVGCTMRSRQLAGAECRHLVVDGTGVGPAVVDLLHREDLQSRLWPVTITGIKSEAHHHHRHPQPARTARKDRRPHAAEHQPDRYDSSGRGGRRRSGWVIRAENYLQRPAPARLGQAA